MTHFRWTAAVVVFTVAVLITPALANFPAGTYGLHGVAMGEATLTEIGQPGNVQHGTMDLVNGVPCQQFIMTWDDANHEYIIFAVCDGSYAGEFQPFGPQPPYRAHTYDSNGLLIGDTYFVPKTP